MAIVERHVSPDGSILLVVDHADGDWTIGLSDARGESLHEAGGMNVFDWHTHGDILDAWGYQGSPDESVRAFVDDVIGSRRVIGVLETDGKITGYLIPDDYVDRPLDKALGKYAEPNETVRFRFWNGEDASESAA